MTKYLIHILILVTIAFVMVTVLNNQEHDELPAFAQVDTIAETHEAAIAIKSTSRVIPSEQQLTFLKTDYSALWAHLNHLYNTNDVAAGKEYYTEDFFKAICEQPAPISRVLNRKDTQHNITITEWARDGLVCVGIDSNVILEYQDDQNETSYTKATIAFALLFQGEHWRLDAIEFINEEKYTLK